MEIVLNNNKNKYLEIFSLGNLDNVHETFKQFSSMKGPLEAKIFAINESISSHQLLKLKNNFDVHLNNISQLQNNLALRLFIVHYF